MKKNTLTLFIGLLLASPGRHTICAQSELQDSTTLTLTEKTVPALYPSSIWSAPLWMNEGMFGTWGLHEGFNANVDLGVRVGWGKYNPWKGGSFFSNLNAMYVAPLSKDKRWNAAFGGYYSNFRMWGDRKNTLGLTGLLDYQINDRLNAGVFVAHDFGLIGNNTYPHSPLPWLDNPSTTIGANLGIKVNENVRLNVSMSYTYFRDQDNFFPQRPPQEPLPSGKPGRPLEGRK